MRVIEYAKSEVELEQEREGYIPTKWWQAVGHNGLLAETSCRGDFKDLNLIDKPEVGFRRLYEKKDFRWVDEHPFPINEEWCTISEFPLYEITKNGEVRLTETQERIHPTLIGDEGHVGYLLKKNVGMHLKSMLQMTTDTFPELIKKDNRPDSTRKVE